MSNADRIVLFYAPQSRSAGALILLEELAAPYELRVLNIKSGENREPAYCAINPMGKVPAILHGDVLVTEQVAIYQYLADLFPAAGLAPGLTDVRRGSYLRWMVFYASCFEPALVDRAMKREPGARAMSPYGDFDTVMATLTAQLRNGPFMFGQDFSAADVLWGTALNWSTRFGLVPERPEITAYVARVMSRPAAVRATARDAQLAASQTA